ncbi:hypothetical protein [Streptomyces sp. NPDC003015]
MLAQNAAGWARLCHLVPAAHAAADGGLPVVSWPVLREHADADLVILLGPAIKGPSTIRTVPLRNRWRRLSVSSGPVQRG